MAFDFGLEDISARKLIQRVSGRVEGAVMEHDVNLQARPTI
jgi:hypothetical protein